jgi:hypothetical protein
LDAANPGDTVMVDTDHQVADRQPASIEVPVSDIKIEGDGTSVIEAASPNPTGDILRIENKENIWVDNLIIDARCGESDGKARNIGGQEVGTLKNIRVTNCVCKNSGRNAINFVNDNTAGDLADFYIANNTVNFASGHGILLGVYDNAGSVRIENVIYENNTVINTNSQAIGIFAVGNNASAENVLYVDNTIDQPPSTDNRGSNSAFEANVSYAAYYANEIISGPDTLQGGITITKGGEQNIVARNKVRNGGRMILVEDRQPFLGGPPRTNLVIGNDCRGGTHGVYYDELDGDLQISDNHIRGIRNVVTDAGGNTGGNYKIFNNGAQVSTSESGLPDRIQNPVELVDSRGDAVGAIAWNRGSPAPDEPVQVTVSVDLDGGVSVPDRS